MRIETKRKAVLPEDVTLEERVVVLKRVSRTQKGGRRQRLFVLAVVGDGQGHVGAGIGKAHELPDAIRKAVNKAKKNMIEVPLLGTTIPHPIIGQLGAAKVLLKPAAPGTGVVAGRAVRAVVEVAGIRDILTKCLGSTNAVNVVWATLKALSELKSPEEVAAIRGKPVHHLLPWLPKVEVRKDEETFAEVEEESHWLHPGSEKDASSLGLEESEPGYSEAQQLSSEGHDRESETSSGSETTGGE